jgi:hypothetical protein
MWFASQRRKATFKTFAEQTQFACVDRFVWCKANEEGQCCRNCLKKAGCKKCCCAVKSGEDKFCGALIPQEVLQTAFTDLTEVCSEINIPFLYEYFVSICTKVMKSIVKMIEG